MSEYIKNRAEQQPKPELVDVSERVRAELLALAKQDDVVATPRGLYALLPGRNIQAIHIAERDCSYTPDTHYTTTIGAEPVAVTQVFTSYGEQVCLRLDVPGHITSALSVPTDTLGSVSFFEQVSDETNEFDRDLKQYLDTKPYANLTPEQLTPDWRHTVQVRAREPLAQPVTVRLARVDAKPQALDGEFVRLESYRDSDTGTVMAKIVSGLHDRGRVDETDWMPIDALEFYPVELERSRALARELCLAAEDLISQKQTYPGYINELLREPDVSTNYPLPHDRWRGHIHDSARASFVLGRVASDVAIDGLFVPRLDRWDTMEKPYLRSHRVIMVDKQPWVVDDTSQLATPLLSPVFDTGRSRFGVSVDQISSELMAAPVQS